MTLWKMQHFTLVVWAPLQEQGTRMMRSVGRLPCRCGTEHAAFPHNYKLSSLLLCQPAKVIAFLNEMQTELQRLLLHGITHSCQEVGGPGTLADEAPDPMQDYFIQMTARHIAG